MKKKIINIKNIKKKKKNEFYDMNMMLLGIQLLLKSHQSDVVNVLVVCGLKIAVNVMLAGKIFLIASIANNYSFIFNYFIVLLQTS